MRIRWTLPAKRDFTHICDYTAEHQGAAAARSAALRIVDGVERLEQFPRLGRPGRKVDTRELVLAGLPFLAIYRIRKNVIEIDRILHGAQKWP